MGDVAFGAFREDAVLLFEAGLLMPREREAGGPTGTIREPRKHLASYMIAVGLFKFTEFYTYRNIVMRREAALTEPYR
jgi:hypothetical protein